jgi:hypothetical protein
MIIIPFPSGSDFVEARFKKPASTPIQQHMRLILPDRSIRVISHDPAPVETILLGEGINPLEVMVSRDGKLITDHQDLPWRLTGGGNPGGSPPAPSARNLQ